jgi:hypothetical protein
MVHRDRRATTHPFICRYLSRIDDLYGNTVLVIRLIDAKTNSNRQIVQFTPVPASGKDQCHEDNYENEPLLHQKTPC